MDIAVFDSGVGGITFLKEVFDLMPNENYIYYADQKHAPYGTKSKEEVLSYVFEVMEFVTKHEIKALVVACNTATSVAVRELRTCYDFPIIGVEPAVKPAILIDDWRKVLVLATALTLKEEKLEALIERCNGREVVDLLAMPKLIELAEEGIFDREEVTAYLRKQFAGYDFSQYKSIVLGCTHFPFFKKYIKELVPRHIKVIDGNYGTAKHLKAILKENKLLNLGKDDGQIIYYSSKNEGYNAPELSKYMDYLKSNWSE